MPGKAAKVARQKLGNRVKAYEAIKGEGLSKESAAQIANAGRTKAGRKRMARKAARTRSK